MSAQGISIPKYTPIPSLGHELGILFGFVGLMLVVTGGYYLAWIEGNKRSSAREAKRRAALVEKGIRPPPSDSNGDTESEGSATHDGVGAGTSTTAASGGMFEEKDSGSGSGKVGEERIEVV